MKKNVLYRLYAAAFVGICLVPSALMPIAENDSTKEKRTLAEFPEITEDGKLNFGYFTQFESWFSDHMAFRQQLVNADGRVKAAVLGTSPNSKVIVGSDGWLYYSDTADSYLRLNTLSDRAINNMARDLELVNDFCVSNGSEFIFTVAPNKNSIYPEHMPFNYKPSDNRSNYERLAEALEGSGFWCDMKETLLSADSSIPLYHKTDTHWNNLGAYAAHVRLMEMLGHETCPSGTKWTTRDDRQGDLAAMIYPAEDAKDTQVYSDYEYGYQYIGRFSGLDDIDIRTSSEKGEGSLLMYRDSFGEAILPYMAEVYQNAEFSRALPYRIAPQPGQTLIIELVERNLSYLITYAPFMAAPEAEIPDAVSVEHSSSDVTCELAPNGAFMHIFGELPEDYYSGSSTRIFVTADGTTYEAFHGFEDELLGRSGELSDRGFSLYVPMNENITADGIVITAVSDDGRAVSNR